MTTSPPRPVDPGTRGTWRLLTDRAFGAVFWGKLIATTGMWMHSVAAVLVIFDETCSATAVGLVSVAQFAPQLLLTPISGVWADHGDRVRQMLVGRAMCVLGSGGLALALLLLRPAGATAVAVVLVCSTAVGLGFVVGGPAMQSIVPDLVAAAELPTAMSLNTVPVTVGRIAGPVLGAYAVAHVGAEVAFGLSALAHALMVLLLLLARLPRRATASADHDSSLGAGLRYLRSRPALISGLVATAAIGLGSEPTLTLAPSLAQRLGGDDGLVGSLSLAFGCGALLGTLTVTVAFRRLTVPATVRAGLCLLAIGSLAAATGIGLVGILVAFVLGGAGLAWSMAATSTQIQQDTDPAFRGRIMALWLVAFIGTRPFVAAGLGLVADHVSTRAAFTVSGSLVLLAACGFGTRHGLHKPTGLSH